MGNTLKKAVVLLLSLVLLAACTDIQQVHEDIKNNTENYIQDFVSGDFKSFAKCFSSGIDENEKYSLLKNTHTACNSIVGKIIEHKFVSEGGGTEEKASGEIVYYNCYPEYMLKTDKGKEYRFIFSYRYICKDDPKKEGVYDIEIVDKSTKA